MTVNDLPTVGYLDQWFRTIHAEIKATVAQAAPPPGEVVYYSVPGLAEMLSVDQKTVRNWIRVGKPSRRDPHNPAANVRLQACYGTSEARIAWPAFLAYERGETFDKATLPPPTAAPPPIKRAAEPDEPALEPRLRKAS